LALDLAAIEEKACARRLEELCEMQDRAIQVLKNALEALKNALEATQLAMNVIEKNRVEQGYKQQIQWQYQQPQYPQQQPYYLYNIQAAPYYLNPQPSSQEKYEYNWMELSASVKDLLNAKDNGNVNEVNSGNQAASGPL
jgi:hypothetical protein